MARITRRPPSSEVVEPIQQPTEPRRPVVITLDIETAPLEVYCWGLWDQNIGLDQVRQGTTVLCFSYKELGKREVHFFSTGGRGVDRVRHDRVVLEKLREVLDDADIVVVQNGKAFDLRRINARMAELGIRPYSPVKVVDTMLSAKRHFAFDSNKLEWLAAKVAGIAKDEHKEFPGFKLWVAVLQDDPKAWAVMEKYNKQDVVACEALYLALRPWIEGHPNVANYYTTDMICCPKCGSSLVHKRGTARTQSGEYHRYQCQACGGWSRTRYTKNSTAKRRGLLSN